MKGNGVILEQGWLRPCVVRPGQKAFTYINKIRAKQNYGRHMYNYNERQLVIFNDDFVSLLYF